MSQYNPEIYSKAPGSLNLNASTATFLEKRARLALRDSGYSPSSSSQMDESPSSSTGEIATTNYTGTTTYSTVPYTLSYLGNNGILVSETKKWTEKICPNTFVMLNASVPPTSVSGITPPPVLLTLPQLNYTLHCEMRGKVNKIVTDMLGRGGFDDGEYHRRMVEAWREVMNKALQWVPAGIMTTSHDNVPTPSASASRHLMKVVQNSGVSYVQNIWGSGVCCGSTLWIRLSSVMCRPTTSKTYVLSDTDVSTVPAIAVLQYCYRLPCFEAVASNIGHTVGFVNSRIALPSVSQILETVDENEPGTEFYLTEVYKIGTCFDLSGLGRKMRSSSSAPVRVSDVTAFSPPGMVNQIQILLTGEM